MRKMLAGKKLQRDTGLRPVPAASDAIKSIFKSAKHGPEARVTI
jgi:hypothetical protein